MFLPFDIPLFGGKDYSRYETGSIESIYKDFFIWCAVNLDAISGLLGF